MTVASTQSRQTAPVVLVTGASRGVGAAVAEQFGALGATVFVNYRDKQKRAEEVAEAIRAARGSAHLAQADITDAAARKAMFEAVRAVAGRLDILVLNASGGLEKDMPPDYAMTLNRDAQAGLLDDALTVLNPGGRAVFVTSHMAHFHGKQPVLDVYEPVAISKRAGEDALRARIPELAARGVSLVVVSGDLIEGTTTPRLMQRQVPGLIETRREQAGALPTIDEFARAIVEAALNTSLESGNTIYVGSVE